MFSLVQSAILGYVLGAIPTAYLLVKLTSNVDIRNVGSGNVGTYNSFEVTNSKLVGLLVLFGDVAKGSVAVLAARYLWDDSFQHVAVASIASVVGHNFPIWLKFKGGRGLATAAGGMALLAWGIVAVWMGLFYVGYKFSKDINIGNAIATYSCALLLLITPHEILSRFLASGIPVGGFVIYAVILLLVIGLRLIQPVTEFLHNRKR